MERRKMKRIWLVATIFVAAAVLGGALGFMPAVAPASDIETLVVSPISPIPLAPVLGYDTLEEAGVQGIARAYRCSHAYECGGAIAQRLSDGKYFIGPVRSDHAGTHVDIEYGTPPGTKLVADYHTHPCNSKEYIPEVFSPTDVSGNTSQRITGFMGDLCTGEVHEFTPNKDSPNDTYVPRAGVYTTGGRIIGHITVDGLSQEPNTGNI